MSLSEAAVIARIRARLMARPMACGGSGTRSQYAVLDPLSLADDAALLAPMPGRVLAISTDTLNAGVHFCLDVAADDLGWKALAVNLSDLAAMGAEPLAYTLALSAPSIAADWLELLLDGLASMQAESGIQLLGGDTTRGPLSLTLTVIGSLPAGQALRRDQAQVGDQILVSGELGSAAAALQELLGQRVADPDLALADAALRRALLRPQPRLALGTFLRGRAHAAMDLSDGLLSDLRRLCQASGVGAEIRLQALPIAAACRKVMGDAAARELALAGGDDYELLFTCGEQLIPAMLAWSAQHQLALTEIGRVVVGSDVRVFDPMQREHQATRSGFEHFTATLK